jgi:hypothetical protein
MLTLTKVNKPLNQNVPTKVKLNNRKKVPEIFFFEKSLLLTFFLGGWLLLLKQAYIFKISIKFSIFMTYFNKKVHSQSNVLTQYSIFQNIDSKDKKMYY